MLINWSMMSEGPFTYFILRLKRHLSSNAKLNLLEQTESVFIHVPKAAGTSVANTIYGLDKYPGHYNWLFYQGYFGKNKYNSMYKFTIVRNPFDRLVSAYEYLKRGGNSLPDKAFSEQYLADCGMFKDFLFKIRKTKPIQNWIHFQPQHRFIFDNKENLKVNYLAHFETLNDDMVKIYSHFGINKELGHAKKITRQNYRDYFKDQESIDIVVNLYKKDFELLGYSTDLHA
jgi:hypothetical protein